MSYYTILLDFYRELIKTGDNTNTRDAVEELILTEHERLKGLES